MRKTDQWGEYLDGKLFDDYFLQLSIDCEANGWHISRIFGAFSINSSTTRRNIISENGRMCDDSIASLECRLSGLSMIQPIDSSLARLLTIIVTHGIITSSTTQLNALTALAEFMNTGDSRFCSLLLDTLGYNEGKLCILCPSGVIRDDMAWSSILFASPKLSFLLHLYLCHFPLVDVVAAEFESVVDFYQFFNGHSNDSSDLLKFHVKKAVEPLIHIASRLWIAAPVQTSISTSLSWPSSRCSVLSTGLYVRIRAPAIDCMNAQITNEREIDNQAHEVDKNLSPFPRCAIETILAEIRIEAEELMKHQNSECAKKSVEYSPFSPISDCGDDGIHSSPVPHYVWLPSPDAVRFSVFDFD